MRRFILSLVVGAVLLFNTLGASAEDSANAAFDTSMISSGIVKISCTSGVEKLKVLIEKNGKRYTYNLNNDGVEESFNLQMGNGEYKVGVLENVGGDKYKYVSTENVKLNLSDAKQVYLASIQNVNWDSSDAAVKKAEELTKDLTNDQDKIKAIYKYLVDNVEYDFDKLDNLPSSYLPDINATISSQKGICYDYASTFAAMLRSEGIPTKLVKGYATNVDGYHAWNEVYNSETNNWMIIDTTYDSQMKAANAKYSMEKKAGQYTKVNEY